MRNIISTISCRITPNPLYFSQSLFEIEQQRIWSLNWVASELLVHSTHIWWWISVVSLSIIPIVENLYHHGCKKWSMLLALCDIPLFSGCWNLDDSLVGQLILILHQSNKLTMSPMSPLNIMSTIQYHEHHFHQTNALLFQTRYPDMITMHFSMLRLDKPHWQIDRSLAQHGDVFILSNRYTEMSRSLLQYCDFQPSSIELFLRGGGIILFCTR